MDKTNSYGQNRDSFDNCGRFVYQEEFENTKRVVRIRKSKKYRQHSSQKKKDKQWSIKLAHKAKDRVTRTPQKIRGWTNVLRKGKQFLFH